MLRESLALVCMALLAGASARAGVCSITETGTNALADGELRIGDLAAGSFGLDGPDCDAAFDALRMGLGLAGHGTLVVENGASLRVDDPTDQAAEALTVGEAGTAVATFRSGARVMVAGNCEVSDFGLSQSLDSGNASLLVEGSDTSLSCGADLEVGIDGPGTLEVRDGATVVAERLESAFEGPGVASIRVASGGLLDITGVRAPGHVFGVRRAGLLDIDGGTLRLSNPSGYLFLCTVPGLCEVDVRVANGGVLDVARSISTDGAVTFTLDGGTIATDVNGVGVCAGCRIEGDGTVSGRIELSGDLAPGLPIGAIEVVADPARRSQGIFQALPGSALWLEIAGPASFDTLHADGFTTIEGSVVVDFVDGYVPAAGSRFELVTAGGALTWSPFSTQVNGLPPETGFELFAEDGAVVLTVPEPAGAPLAALAAVGIVAWRRSRAPRGGSPMRNVSPTLLALLGLLGAVWPGPAAAHHELDPCDLGGVADGGEVGDPPIVCSLLDPPFTFGTSATLGSDAFSAGGSDFARRKLVIEGHAESGSAAIQEIRSNLNPELVLAEAAAWARTTANEFGLGVYAKDLNGTQGDAFVLTDEAAEAYAAVGYTFLGGQGWVDIPIDLDGSFGGTLTEGRATFQVSFRDFHGNHLGTVFAASNTAGGSAHWREIICDEPPNGACPTVDHAGRWPGRIQRTLQLPVLPDNGIWVKMTAAANTSDAPVWADFRSSVRITADPPPGQQVVLASGQVFGDAPPSTTPFSMVVQAGAPRPDGGPGEAHADSAGNVPERLAVVGTEGTAEAAGLPGRARMRVATQADFATSDFAEAFPRAGLSWWDTVTFSGADRFAFEFQVDGTATAQGPGFHRDAASAACTIFLEVGDARSATEWVWNVLPDGEVCPGDRLPSGGGCLLVEQRLADGVRVELPQGEDPNQGPLRVRYDWPLSGVAELGASFGCDLEVLGRAREGDSGTATLELDFGSAGGFTLLGVTGVDALGDPVPTASVLSATGYDYTTPPPVIEALPEPGAAARALAALLALAALRSRAARGQESAQKEPPQAPEGRAQ
ncbi:MAG: hypothetical protein QNK03_08450 [Myxococcota bacterium]|nr:hypothetical protein [Myxococcota bacterium]